MQKNKGISLIVLVITIIVMIILAGSIIITLSNSGIITKANEAVDLSNDKQMQEYITSELILNGWYSGKPITEELLKKIDGFNVTAAEVEGAWIIEKDGAKTTIYETGDIVKGETKLWNGESSAPEIKEGNWYIYTPAQLKFLADVVNGGNITEGYKIEETTIVYLMNDLDLGARHQNGTKTVGTEWIPIGTTSALKFMGTFEGNNHTIRGVYVSIDDKFGGIFGNSNTIQNLTIKDSYIKSGNNCAGGIVAALRNNTAENCVLENCHNINTVVIADGRNVGGVVGQFGGDTLKDCTNTGSVSNTVAVENYAQVGGVVGHVMSNVNSVTNCTNYGSVNGIGYAAGGVVGNVSKDVNSVTNCTNYGSVNVTGIGVGGVVGNNQTLLLKNCINYGNVNSSAEQIGGISGNVIKSGVVVDCENNGNVLGSGKRVGGIVGMMFAGATVTNCKNNGNVLGSDERVGGIIGDSTVASGVPVVVSNCVNTGNVEGKNNYVGGIIGGLIGKLDNCYNTGTIKLSGDNIRGVGGIVGTTLYASDSVSDIDKSIVKNTYNTGKIVSEGNNNSMLGGIVGVTNGNRCNITNNYSAGQIVAKGQNITYVGAVIGLPQAEIGVHDEYEYGTDALGMNYYLQGVTTVQPTETTLKYETSKTSAEMKTADFVKLLGETVWEIRAGENSGYPVLIGLK